MDDTTIAALLSASMRIEGDLRADWIGQDDVAEKDSVLIVGRHATAMRKSLEGWIARRAMRAQLTTGAIARKAG